MIPILRDKTGVMHIPLALALIVLISAGFGIWGFLRHWRKSVEVQLGLDKCVASTALSLRNIMTEIESDNDNIKNLRIAITASILVPEIHAPLKLALDAIVARQNIKLSIWRARRAEWFLNQDCSISHAASHRDPPPVLKWRRDTPDILGPKQLDWPEKMPKFFIIKAVSLTPKLSRTAVAVVHKKVHRKLQKSEGKDDARKWKAEFTSVSQIRTNFGPGIY